MHRNRHAYDVGDEDEIAVAVGLVGTVFPFEYQPKTRAVQKDEKA